MMLVFLRGPKGIRGMAQFLTRASSKEEAVCVHYKGPDFYDWALLVQGIALLLSAKSV